MKRVFFSILLVLTALSVLSANDNKWKLSLTGTDPTEVRDRFDFIIGEAQFTSSFNTFGVSAQGYKAVLSWLSVGVKVPFIYSHADYEDKFSMGDVNLGLLASFYSNKNSTMFTRFAFGLKYYLNSGDPDIGTGVGQQYVAPSLKAIFMTPEGDAFIAPVIEYYYSINNDPNYLEINKLALKIDGTLTFNDYWITVSPQVRFDFNDVYVNTYYIASSIGKMVTSKWGVSADFIYRFAGEPDFDYLGRLNIRYLF
jgi:hypothetical protein